MNIEKMIKNSVVNFDEMGELGKVIRYLDENNIDKDMQKFYLFEYGKKIGQKKAANPER